MAEPETSLHVVTGAAGFVGNNIVRTLLRRGCRVRAVVHGAQQALAGLDVEIVQAEVRDAASLEAAFAGAACVYHCAAVISLLGDPRGVVHATNVDGARRAARVALELGVPRYVHVSSCHAFALEDSPISETSLRPGRSHPAYDRSKAAGEAAVREVIADGLAAVILNPAGILGPYDFAPSPVGQLLVDMKERKLKATIEGGFPWVDVRDVAAAAVEAGSVGRIGHNYLLASEYVSIRDLAGLVHGCTGSRPPRLHLPMSLARSVVPLMDAAERLGWTPPYTSEKLRPLRAARVMDCARARAELNWQPRPVAESVADTFAWRARVGLP